MRGCNLRGADLSDIDLTGVDFTEAILIGVDFTDNENITGVIFDTSSLVDAIFNGARIVNSGFRDANLGRTQFLRTLIVESTFDTCDFVDTSFKEAQIVLTGFFEPTRALRLSFELAVIESCYFLRVNFKGVNFKRVSIEGRPGEECIKECSFKAFDFTNARLINVNFDKPNFHPDARTLLKAGISTVEAGFAGYIGTIAGTVAIIGITGGTATPVFIGGLVFGGGVGTFTGKHCYDELDREDRENICRSLENVRIARGCVFYRAKDMSQSAKRSLEGRQAVFVSLLERVWDDWYGREVLGGIVPIAASILLGKALRKR